jgi:hypothetical protein
MCYGAHSIWPISDLAVTSWRSYPIVDLFVLVPQSDQWVLCLFVLLVVSTVCLCAGFRTRLSAFVCFVLLLSLQRHFPANLNSSDTLERLMLFLLCFSPAGNTLSLDVWMRSNSGRERVLHAPFAQRLMQVQLSLAYYSAFCAKIASPFWRDGTALYYALRYREYVHFPVGGFISDNLPVLKLLDWSTLVIELSLWTLIWIKPLRYWVILAGVVFHISIDYAFNLPVFEWLFIASYLLFVEEKDMRAIIARITKSVAQSDHTTGGASTAEAGSAG